MSTIFSAGLNSREVGPERTSSRVLECFHDIFHFRLCLMGAKPKNRNLACQESAKARLISGTDALRETPYA
jgi:hypothetical protein